METRLKAVADRSTEDAEILAEDPAVGDALKGLTQSLAGIGELRWSPRRPETLRAAVRAVAAAKAELDAVFLNLVHEVDTRDDVVPDRRVKHTAAGFLRAGLGWDRGRARREAELATQVNASGGDLPQVRAAYAAGAVSREHVEIAMSVHDRLGPLVRETHTRLTDPMTGESCQRRCIEGVDAMLALYARVFTVPEFRRIADRIVENLDPPTPDSSHERRYLHLSRLTDGSLMGKFACGPEQALRLLAVINAGNAPQPGVAVDVHGVQHPIRDERTKAQRDLDALVDATHRGCPNPADHQELQHTGAMTEPTDMADGNEAAEENTPPRGENTAREAAGNGPDRDDPEECEEVEESDALDELEEFSEPEEFEEPPPLEGELETRRPPGVRAGRYPDPDITVIATLDQLAHARAHHHHARRTRDSPSDLQQEFGIFGGSPPGGAGCPVNADYTAHDPTAGPGPAYAPGIGPIQPQTLALLACSARLRAVVLDEHGAVLNLGRSQRLATNAQRRALDARDIGCVIPGCTVPGDRCEVHHVLPWVDGGATDVENMCFVCPRHHVEVGDGIWDIEMIDGVPWARPPAWAHPTRPLLRNITHRIPR